MTGAFFKYLIPLAFLSVPVSASVVTDATMTAGALRLDVQRELIAGRDTPGILGSHWRSNWEVRIERAAEQVILYQSNSAATFVRTAPDTYEAGPEDRITFTGGRATRAIGGMREIFDAQGRLVERRAAHGATILLRYDNDRRLAEVTGPAEQWIRFSYNPSGRATRITTSIGDLVEYTYNADALIAVRINGGPAVTFDYNDRGLLSRVGDPKTGATEFIYDAQGRLTRRRFADGADDIEKTPSLPNVQYSSGTISLSGAGGNARLELDAIGRISRVVMPGGAETRYEYAMSGALAGILRPGNVREEFEYDARGNLAAIKRAEVTVASYTYNPDGTRASASEESRPAERYTYFPNGNLRSVANALGEATTFEYDARGNLIAVTNPLAGVTRLTYDDHRRITQIVDASGLPTTFQYDAAGRLIATAGGNHPPHRFEYDARGRNTAEIDPAGRVTRYEYDTNSRVTKVILPGNLVLTREYDAQGNVVRIVDEAGRVIEASYDSVGRLVREKDWTGYEIRRSFDPAGNLAQIEQSGAGPTRLTWDIAGQLIATEAPQGSSKYQYDALGRTIAGVDAAGGSETLSYSATGDLTAMVEPNGDQTRYEYDAAGQLTSVRGPSGGVTRIGYNALGIPTSITDPLGNTRRLVTDPGGRLTAEVDAAGRRTEFAYDPAGRLIRELPEGAPPVEYRYNTAGQLINASSGGADVLYGYDQAGRIVMASYPAIKKTVSYSFEQGLLALTALPEIGQIRYQYDERKRLSKLIAPGGNVAFQYDSGGRLERIIYPSGVTAQYSYDAAGHFASIRYRNAQKDLATWNYRYTANSNVARIEDHAGKIYSYDYDPVHSIIRESGPSGAIEYRYAPGGNRTAVISGGSTTGYQHDAADRMIAAGSERLTYGRDGELTGRGGTSYSYDAFGRLVQVKSVTSTVGYTYAPSGERLQRRSDRGSVTYLYQGGLLVAEYLATGSRTAYVYNPMTRAPLAMIREGKILAYLTDAAGNVRHIADDRGEIAASYEYDAFGNVLSRSGLIANTLLHAGREWDEDAKLYYFQARYYDPRIGRFLTPDPAWTPAARPVDHNPYLYARNNPLRFADATGLDYYSLRPGYRPLWPYVEDLRQAQREFKSVNQRVPVHRITGKRLETFEYIRAQERLAEARRELLRNPIPPNWHNEELYRRIHSGLYDLRNHAKWLARHPESPNFKKLDSMYVSMIEHEERLWQLEQKGMKPQVPETYRKWYHLPDPEAPTVDPGAARPPLGPEGTLVERGRASSGTGTGTNSVALPKKTTVAVPNLPRQQYANWPHEPPSATSVTNPGRIARGAEWMAQNPNKVNAIFGIAEFAACFASRGDAMSCLKQMAQSQAEAAILVKLLGTPAAMTFWATKSTKGLIELYADALAREEERLRREAERLSNLRDPNLRETLARLEQELRELEAAGTTLAARFEELRRQYNPDIDDLQRRLEEILRSSSYFGGVKRTCEAAVGAFDSLNREETASVAFRSEVVGSVQTAVVTGRACSNPQQLATMGAALVKLNELRGRGEGHKAKARSWANDASAADREIRNASDQLRSVNTLVQGLLQKIPAPVTTSQGSPREQVAELERQRADFEERKLRLRESLESIALPPDGDPLRDSLLVMRTKTAVPSFEVKDLAELKAAVGAPVNTAVQNARVISEAAIGLLQEFESASNSCKRVSTPEQIRDRVIANVDVAIGNMPVDELRRLTEACRLRLSCSDPAKLQTARSLIQQGAFGLAQGALNELKGLGCDVSALQAEHDALLAKLRELTNSFNQAQRTCNFGPTRSAVEAFLQSYPGFQPVRPFLDQLKLWENMQTSVASLLERARNAPNRGTAEALLNEARPLATVSCLKSMVDGFWTHPGNWEGPPRELPPPPRQEQTGQKKTTNMAKNQPADDGSNRQGRDGEMVGACHATITAQPKQGYFGETTNLTVTVDAPWNAQITKVDLLVDGRELAGVKSEGNGKFTRVATFRGVAGPITLLFVARDTKGDIRCQGTIDLRSLGPRRR